MNTSNHSKNLFALPVLIASLGLILAAPVMAQTFRTLHTFTELSVVVSNSDGAGPWGELILSGSTLYGTTEIGGSSGNGTVFAINTDGTGFTNLHSFTPLFGIHLVNCDGASPRAGLVLSGNGVVRRMSSSILLTPA